MSVDTLISKNARRARRTYRTRKRLQGSTERPRLSVHISHQHVLAQLIDDENGKTLVHVTTLKRQPGGTMTDKAAWVGAEIAKKATKLKISQVIFDRGNRRYHGRLKKLADEARAQGLEF